MATEFKKAPAGLAIEYNGLFVGMIYKQRKGAEGWKCDHYGLAYNNGRYERYRLLSEAKDAARKIMARIGVTGATELF